MTMAMIDYDNYNPLDVYGNPEFPTTYEEEEDFHAVFTVQLGELIHDGVINFHDGSWINMPEKFQSGGNIKWYNSEQRERFWNKFQARFFWREIGELPVMRWKWDVLSKLLSLMPQYYEMYKLVDSGMSPLQIGQQFGTWNRGLDSSKSGAINAIGTKTENTTKNGTVNRDISDSENYTENTDKYGKKRDVFSDFPQTQLGNNQDYASSGSDNEYEDIGNVSRNVTKTTSDDTTSNETGSLTGRTTDDTESSETGTETENYSKTDTQNGGFIDTINDLHGRYRDIDLWLLNEFDSNFYCVLSSNMNGY
jgi:hypothetical protein